MQICRYTCIFCFKSALVERLQAAISESDDNNDKVNSDETIHNEDIEEESDE